MVVWVKTCNLKAQTDFFTLSNDLLPMEQVTEVPELHRRLTDWKGEVDHLRGDMESLNQRLVEIAGKANRQETLAQIEHFQNQFICQKEVADELFQELKQTAKKLAAGDGRAPQKADSYNGLADRVNTFNRLYKELKDEFHQFISEA